MVALPLYMHTWSPSRPLVHHNRLAPDPFSPWRICLSSTAIGPFESPKSAPTAIFSPKGCSVKITSPLVNHRSYFLGKLMEQIYLVSRLIGRDRLRANCSRKTNIWVSCIASRGTLSQRAICCIPLHKVPLIYCLIVAACVRLRELHISYTRNTNCS